MLEARDRVGGRVLDDHNMGVCIAKGAQIVPGCVNNPITLLSHQVIHVFMLLSALFFHNNIGFNISDLKSDFFGRQANIQLIEMSELCTLIDEKGQVLEDTLSQYMDFHFNSLLDNLDMWRKRRERQDVNLLSET